MSAKQENPYPPPYSRQVAPAPPAPPPPPPSRVHPTMQVFVNAIAPKPNQWTLDHEHVENSDHVIYFVMSGNITVATCRRREDAERIVKDHNNEPGLLAANKPVDDIEWSWPDDGDGTVASYKGRTLRVSAVTNRYDCFIDERCVGHVDNLTKAKANLKHLVDGTS